MAIEKRVQIEDIDKFKDEEDVQTDGEGGGDRQDAFNKEGQIPERHHQEGVSGEEKPSNDEIKQSKMDSDESGDGGAAMVDEPAVRAEKKQGEVEQRIEQVGKVNSSRTDGSGDDEVTDEAATQTEVDSTRPTRHQHGDNVPANPTTQTIDISIPQVEKDGTNDDDEIHDDDVDADTQSVVMGTTKSVTFSIHQPNLDDVDDIDDEIARVTLNKASDDQMSNFEVEVDTEGRAQTTNTPVTVVTEYQGVRKSPDNQREDIYEHAISVMRNRSSMTHYSHSQTTIKSNLSVGSKAYSRANNYKLSAKGLPVYELPTVIAKLQEPPFSSVANCSFYVLQKRIHPVPPIRAWKGYHNNVYFEPMVCRKAKLSSHEQSGDYPQNMIKEAPPRSAQRTPKPISNEGVELPQITDTNEQGAAKATSVKSVRIAKSAASVRTGTKSRSSRSRASTSMPKSRPLTTASRKFAVLDKYSVLDNMDSYVGEDMRWIDGLESTGTLQAGEPMRRTGSTTHIYTRGAGSSHYKMRICRGLVSHNLAAGSGQFPALHDGVNGGRIVDTPSKLEYLEKEYQGESHFLSNPGMFASPVPADSRYSSSPLPSLRRQSSAALSNSQSSTSNSPVGHKK